MRVHLLAITILSGLISSACVSSEDERWVSLAKTTGQGIYKEKCGMCHQGIGMGVGILARRNTPEMALLENRNDLQSEFVETVVRNGFGIMLPFTRGEVSDDQLQAISDYLVKEE